MARERERRERSDGYTDDLNKDVAPEQDEGCNAYYTRKQRTKLNEVAPDTDADYAPPDRNAEAEHENYKNPDAGPLNYKKWDRYGK